MGLQKGPKWNSKQKLSSILVEQNAGPRIVTRINSINQSRRACFDRFQFSKSSPFYSCVVLNLSFGAVSGTRSVFWCVIRNQRYENAYFDVLFDFSNYVTFAHLEGEVSVLEP